MWCMVEASIKHRVWRRPRPCAAPGCLLVSLASCMKQGSCRARADWAHKGVRLLGRCRLGRFGKAFDVQEQLQEVQSRCAVKRLQMEAQSLAQTLFTDC